MIRAVLVIHRLGERREKAKIARPPNELVGYSKVKSVVFLLLERINARESMVVFWVKISFCALNSDYTNQHRTLNP